MSRLPARVAAGTTGLFAGVALAQTAPGPWWWAGVAVVAFLWWVAERRAVEAHTLRVDALDRAKAIYEAKLADADQRETALADALARLKWAITAPASDADQLDAAITDAENVLAGDGYTGELAAARANQALAERDAVTLAQALDDLLAALERGETIDIAAARKPVDQWWVRT